MKDLENALGKCRDGFAALADALPYTRLDKDGTAIIGLRELCADGCADGKKPGLFLKWELWDWDSEADACYYGAADGQWQHHGWKMDDMVEKLRGEDAADVFSSVKELELLLRMAEHLGVHITWAEELD